ncbi:hypothetical protein OG777_27555 [Micromonospora peucetia]|uniref:Uncharacterized protein n=1 Tax=Micromonospora peucetia TaxID=47871 RepID=A0A1C6VYJ7_9ACTN|nr:hypothetical protein [Micromonospora peucetia]MCX4390657.1 hypothetical protein [Micromonospora peucetia]WSA31607.1 hypothetical protein OIE14_26320 [Micromonospora peucetia]SCL71393.1 hypothetical protein GA0070608_4632 [Micromonospora peucetia]
MTGEVRRFAFRFDPAFRPALALLGVRPATAWVDVAPDELVVRFGPWRLRTARRNIVGVAPTGPYRWWRGIGTRLSLADAGVTFASSTVAGLCLRFAQPVPALLPGGLLRHPGVTVTVADPDALARVLAASEGD